MGVEEGILKSCRISSRGFDGSELLSGSILYVPQNVKWGRLIICYVERELMKLNVITFAMRLGNFGGKLLQTTGLEEQIHLLLSQKALGSRWQAGRPLAKGAVICHGVYSTSPSPASVTLTTGAFSLVHCF